MNWKLAFGALALACSALAPGCAADAEPIDGAGSDADAEEATTSQDELIANATGVCQRDSDPCGCRAFVFGGKVQPTMCTD